MNVKKNNSVELAEHFLLSTIKNGLAHSYDVKKQRWVKPYPEVTGYILSYFSKYCSVIPVEVHLAAKQLCKIQHQTGGFPSFDTGPYLFTFDTAQILHGLLSLYRRTNERTLLNASKKAAAFIMNMQTDNGAMFPIYNTAINAKYVNNDGAWGHSFSYIQIKNVEGLLLLNELTGDSCYLAVVKKLVKYGRENFDLTFTHPGAYFFEGMLAAGEKEFVSTQLKEKIVPRLRPNGFLPYSEGLHYAYVSGSIQMGILLYKVGLVEQARLIFEWARVVQSNHCSGGLFQYANADGNLNSVIHSELNSWGTKYYSELARLFV
jgi:hypothetical protein